MKIVIKPEHIHGAVVGYVAGVAYMAVAVTMIDKKRVRIFKRTEHFNKRLVEEAWVYLPTDVKNKINDEIKFYNIAHKEDI